MTHFQFRPTLESLGERIVPNAAPVALAAAAAHLADAAGSDRDAENYRDKTN